ncbi:glycoside hydrolase family 43 protein [Paenibacillus sp. PR3]|uniref:Glycoside hydrolase family 43 protein n=1 Tax=Paenibacillus terricola TaxID=2763503 RepID=A0ABR8N2X0_9BACL|nr:glycoside hydrolase family 43 protein [Paenibacillus terricola]MBD3921757.1 glycoside hydrolase family 43 protein [Paenibacillus terricola]
MSAYLFVHFREKTTPEGEQVYFGVSKDGFNWEQVNGGQPVLWSKQGDQGVRDHTIVRTRDGRFYILATDLSLANGFHTKYESSWENISRKGSRCLSLWESGDLVNWSEQRMVELGDEDFGCLWAPDVLYDRDRDDYVIHWSSAHASNNYGHKAIFYTRTKDFVRFDRPQLLCRKDGSGIIDPAIYEENGTFYRFLKSEGDPAGIILQAGNTLTGTHERIEAFDEEMAKLGSSAYEGPTAFKLANGQWCLMLDFFGVKGDGQGYVPFVADDLNSGRFIRSEGQFSFPYRFKHGTVLAITDEEYDRIVKHYA